MASLNTWFSSGFLRAKQRIESDITIRVLAVEQGFDGKFRVTASTGVGDVVFHTDSVLVVGQELTADLSRNAGRSDGLCVTNVRS